MRRFQRSGGPGRRTVRRELASSAGAPGRWPGRGASAARMRRVTGVVALGFLRACRATSGGVRRRRCPSNDSGGRAAGSDGPNDELLADGPREQHLARALEDDSRTSSPGRRTVRPAIDTPSTSTAPPSGRRQAHRGPEQRSSCPEPFGPSTATTSRGAEPRARRRGAPRARRMPARTSRNSRRGGRSSAAVGCRPTASGRGPGGRASPRAECICRLPPAEPLEHDLERELHCATGRRPPGTRRRRRGSGSGPRRGTGRGPAGGRAPPRRGARRSRRRGRRRRARRSVARRRAAVTGSRFASGSSTTYRRGCIIRIPAIARSWRSPPDSVGRLATQERLDARPRRTPSGCGRRISPRSMPRFSGPKASSASTVAPTIWLAPDPGAASRRCARSRAASARSSGRPPTQHGRRSARPGRRAGSGR